jgi:ankyrin repeat protein
MLEPPCVNCGGSARTKCSKCSSPICSPECAARNWTTIHKKLCREIQAKQYGVEYAEGDNRGWCFAQAVMADNTTAMEKLVDGLTGAIATNKKLKKAAPAAVKAFVDFIDPRGVGGAAFGAAQEGSMAAMALLHSLGADLDILSTGQGATPATIAAANGRTEIIQLLAELRANVHWCNTPCHSSTLRFATQKGHFEIVRLLLQLRADTNAQDELGNTACHDAAHFGHHRVVHALVNARANPDLQCKTGGTPLYMTAQAGQTSAAITLVACRASLNIPMHNRGTTAIAKAAHMNHDEIVRLLAHAGAHLHIASGVNAGRGFWGACSDGATRQRMNTFWRGVAAAEANQKSPEGGLRIRRKMMIKAKMLDPRDL